MTNIHAGVFALLVSTALTASGAEERKPRSRVPAVLDATHPIDERVADLLGRMTFEEKVGQLRGGWPGVTAYEKTDAGVEIADAWKPLLADAPIGLLGSTLRAEPWLGMTREIGLSRREGAMFLNAKVWADSWQNGYRRKQDEWPDRTCSENATVHRRRSALSTGFGGYTR